MSDLERERATKLMQKKMAATFRAQGRAVLSGFVRFKRHFAEAALDSSLDSMIEGALKVTVPAMVKDFTATGLAGYEWGYADLANNLGMQDAFSLAHPDAVKWADKRAALRVAGVNDTTKGQIRNLIVHGLENGESYGSVQRSIKAQFTQFAVGSPLEHIQSRAELVAVTEMGEAYEAGAATLSDDLEAHGIEQEKSRVGPNDGHTSDACIADLAVGWIAKSEPFPSGIMSGLEHPGCRHGTIYRVARGEVAPGVAPTMTAKAKAAKGITVPRIPKLPKTARAVEPSPVKITNVAKKDIDYLALDKQIGEWSGDRSEYAAKALLDIHRGHGAKGLMAYDDGELVGVLSYEKFTDLINLSFIGTSHSGVGELLVNKLKKEGMNLVLTAEAGSDPFWLKQGFKLIKEHTYLYTAP